MAILVYLHGWDIEPWQAALNQAMPESDIRYYPDIGKVEEIDYLLCWNLKQQILDDLPNLKALFSMGAGVDHLLKLQNLPNIPIYRVINEDLSARMAEYALMHCLIILRNQKTYQQQQTQKLWLEIENCPKATDVKVGIMGLGQIGQCVARYLFGVGFQINGWSQSQKNVENVKSFSGESGLKTFLNESDILINILPDTADTKNIVNKDFLNQLQKRTPLGGVHYINIGRGATQNEADLIDALDEGQLASAVIDVFSIEPLPKENPLWAHPKVTLTPHIAGPSDPNHIANFIAQQIDNVKHKREIAAQYLVNLQKGY